MYALANEFVVDINILKNSRAARPAQGPALNDCIRTLQRTWAAILVPEYHLDRAQAEAVSPPLTEVLTVLHYLHHNTELISLCVKHVCVQLVNKCFRNMQIELENDLSELRRLKLEAERKAADISVEEALRKRLENMTPEEAQALGLVGSAHGTAIGNQNVVAVRYVYADGTPVDNPAHLPEGAHIAEAAANANLRATAQLAAAAAKQAEAQALAVAGNMAMASEMQARFSHAKGDPQGGKKQIAELQEYYRQQRAQMEEQIRTANKGIGNTVENCDKESILQNHYPTHHTVAEHCTAYSHPLQQKEAQMQQVSFRPQQSHLDGVNQRTTLHARGGQKAETVEGVAPLTSNMNGSIAHMRMSSLPPTGTASGFPLYPSHCPGNVGPHEGGTLGSLQGQGIWKRSEQTEKEFFRRSRCPSFRSAGQKEAPQRSLSLSNPLRSAGRLLQALGLWKFEEDQECQQDDLTEITSQKPDRPNAQSATAVPTNCEGVDTMTCQGTIQSSMNAGFHVVDTPVVALETQVHQLHHHIQQQVHQNFLQQVRQTHDSAFSRKKEPVTPARNTVSRIAVKSLAEVPPVQLGRQHVVGVERINAQLSALSPQQVQQYASQYGTYSTPEEAAAAFGGVPLPGVGALQNRGQASNTTGTQLVMIPKVMERNVLGTIEQVAAIKQREFATRRPSDHEETVKMHR